MSLEDARSQKSGQLELPLECRGEAPRGSGSVEASSAANGEVGLGASGLMEQVCERRNLQAALKRVKENKGSPGVDGMTVEDLPAYLREHWPRLREEILAGVYVPEPVRRVTIPKVGGGERELGIPTVVDRFIQQAVLQVLQPRIDPSFSEHSFGFRPGRRAQDAVCLAQRYVQEGRWWVVDIDLEKFFDRVNHDVLMGRLAKRIEDRRILGLIRRYLEAGILLNGVSIERHEGTPQGGPLSPLLANVLLDEVDKELEKRGHAFVRYADDLNVYVRTKRAGERVMEGLRTLYARLKLRVNETKSAVGRATERKFLGFSFWITRRCEVLRRISPESLVRLKACVRKMTSRTIGRSLAQVCGRLRAYLQGWRGYYKFTQTPKILADLDGWIRHRLRAIQLKQWRRGKTVYRELISRGLNPRSACGVAAHTRSWWRTSRFDFHLVFPNKLFDDLGLPRLAA